MQKQHAKTACDEHCNFRLPKEELQKLSSIAEQRGVKRAKVIREALKLYLTNVAA